jgi:hypothetical protein
MQEIYDRVTPPEQEVLASRLGMFNILSAFKLNRVYEFYLDRVEDRRLAIIFVKLGDLEPVRTI